MVVMVVVVVVDTPEHRLIALLCFAFLLPHPPLSLLRSVLLIVILPLIFISTGTVTSHVTLQCRHQLLGPSGQLGSPHRRHKRYQEGSGDDLGCYESYYGWVFVSVFRDSAGGRGGRREKEGGG
jgi:hypothetical protein